LRLPVNSLNGALNSLRDLGVVKQETEASENTSAERETLSSQIELKRAELERLNSIVTHRSGSLPDTVQAEEKIAERRGELSELEKQFHGLEDRVEYALVELRIMEQYHARLDWQFAGLFSDLRNSLVDGIGTLINSLAGVLGFLLHYGLVTFLWVGVLYLPARSLWRRYRKMISPAEPSVA
jgi:chromosome segregation ATPase